MNDDTPEQLDAAKLLGLFQEISDRLAQRGETAQLFVVGGAAMALAYDGGRMTRDVDAIFAPAGRIRRLAAELSEEHDLEPDWINDAAKGYMPGTDEQPKTTLPHGPCKHG